MKKMFFLLAICIFSGIALYAQDSLKAYVGKYKFPEGSVVPEIEVILENGALMFKSNMGNTAIERNGGDEFSIPAYSGVATFTRNEAKKITGLHIEAQGTVLDGTLVEPKPDAEKSGTNDDINFNPKYLLSPTIGSLGGE
jgi:hypothetical protein